MNRLRVLRQAVARGGLLAALLAGASACSGEAGRDGDDSPSDGYEWGLPAGVTPPPVPADNPITPAKVELGRHLFYDARLSTDGETSCATCHQQERAFSDGLAKSLHPSGDSTRRGALPLVNVAYRSHLNWASLSVTTLEEQLRDSMFGAHPVMLAEELPTAVAGDALYAELFARAFPEEQEPRSVDNAVRAIASFERTLLSFGSDYDDWVYGGDDDALSASAHRGRELFFSERLECFHCHGGATFSGPLDHSGRPVAEQPFHNTGLYNVDGRGSYPSHDTGLFEQTGRPTDMGRFRAPSLRNVALTAPYMHDGSIETLDEVIEHYAYGGRTVHDGPNAGVGAENPFKSPFVRGFLIDAGERADLVAFLQSLTDEQFVSNPALRAPER